MEIPASISTAALTNMLDEAPCDEDQVSGYCTCDKGSGPFAGLSQKELTELAETSVTEAMEKCSHPMVHKLMAIKCLLQLGGFHKAMAENELEEGNKDSALCWMSDEGQLYSAYKLITAVCMGADDWYCNDED